MSETLLERMANHDNNEERRYLREGPRLHLTWSYVWLNWSLGPGFTYDPYSTERWSAWFHIGPLTIEAYWAAGA